MYKASEDDRTKTMSMPQFIYEPLDLIEPSFRLVRLARGTEGPVVCELFHALIHDASDSIDYEALSYTWGSTRRSHRITVNNRNLMITESLHDALRHLRDDLEDRILWIDAICIDQDNQTERGYQVQQMASIYERARQVIIWLGLGTPETDTLFDSIRRLERHALNFACSDWTPSDRRWQFLWSTVTVGETPVTEHQSSKTHCFRMLLWRDWFMRVWVLQEVAKARAARVVCGTKAVSARIFALMPPLLGVEPDYRTQSVLDIMPGPSRKYSWWTETRDLHTLLHRFQGSQASDSRDLIYALLGISSDAADNSALLPDYNKSEEEVVQDAIAFILDLQSHGVLASSLPRWGLKDFRRNLRCLRGMLLNWALEQGSESLIDCLVEGLRLDTGAVPIDGRQNFYGRTPLSWAASHGHETRATLLLEAGTEIESRDWLDQTPLSLAAEYGHAGIVKILLHHSNADQAHVDINTTDWRGRTPLAWAAGKGYEAVVRTLLEHPGINKTPVDKSGWTPLSLAIENGHQSIVDILQPFGPAIDTQEPDSASDTENLDSLSGFLTFAMGQPYNSLIKSTYPSDL